MPDGCDEVTLRDYLEAKLHATERALDLSRAELERRLESMNEFREQLRCQAATFLTRQEFEAKYLLLIEKMESAAKGKVPWGVTIALTLFTAAIVGLLMSVVNRG